MFILWGVHGEHFLYFSLCHIGQINVRLIIIVTMILIHVLLIIIIIVRCLKIKAKAIRWSN